MLTAGRRACTLAIVWALAAVSLVAAGDLVADRAEVEKWRAEHEASYRRQYVPLAGLFFLKPGPNTAGSAGGSVVLLPKSVAPRIGLFVLDGRRVRFEPASGATVRLRNTPVLSAIELKSDANDMPDELESGGVTFWVHESGERPTIRLRDENSDMARSFTGFRWFPIDERYRVTARFIKDPAPHDLHMPNLMGDEDVMTTEGVAEFTLDGKKVRLRPVTTSPKRLWFIIRDGTSGRETYDTARFLYADLRDDGTTVLDFNELYNPPCAFNPYTTCPLPLPENRIKTRILAGEKAYQPAGRSAKREGGGR